MTITIYIIKNLINNKVYVGQSKRFKTRISQHFRSSKHENCPYPIGRAIKKYGKENFSVEVIEEIDESRADERERHWISHFDSVNPQKGYNLESGGNSLKTLSEETRRKISESRRVWYESLNEEELKAYCAKRKNMVRSEDGLANNKKAVLQALKGVRKTSEHCERIRQALFKLTIEQAKEMQELSLRGVSAKELAKRYQLSYSTTRRYLRRQM